MDNNVLNLDEIKEDPRYIIINEEKYEIKRLSLGENFEYTATVEKAERIRVGDNPKAYATIMRQATMMLIPEIDIKAFELIRGEKLKALLEFLQNDDEEGDDENPTETPSES